MPHERYGLAKTGECLLGRREKTCAVWRRVRGTIRPLRLERSYFREKRVRLLTAGEPSMAVTQMQVPVGLSDHHAIECTQYALRDVCGASNLAFGTTRCYDASELELSGSSVWARCYCYLVTQSLHVRRSSCLVGARIPPKMRLRTVFSACLLHACLSCDG